MTGNGLVGATGSARARRVHVRLVEVRGAVEPDGQLPARERVPVGGGRRAADGRGAGGRVVLVVPPVGDQGALHVRDGHLDATGLDDLHAAGHTSPGGEVLVHEVAGRARH